jgi:hypothetical protein
MLTAALACGCGCSPSSAVKGPEASGPRVVRASDLRIECGTIGGTTDLLAVRSACTRAVVGDEPRPGTSIAFAYLGPTRDIEPLASGELRQQIGLKLRARDTCNVVYVMWHITPTPGVFVSVKSNPGLSDHAACGDHGYINLPATGASSQAPILVPGDHHTLEARIERPRMRVLADGILVWDGELPASAFAFDGPVGLRSDNAEFDVEMRTVP